MKPVETSYRGDVIAEIQEKLPFFMKYMGDTVDQLIKGQIGLRTFEEAYKDSYKEAEEQSKKIDEKYERGDYGRPGIMDGGPDYISYFDSDRQRCLDILREKGIPLTIC